ncbi:MAG: cation diffusion facilitator family transporter [Planctomycetes bacterium]|nr:cation diffusion facilitator family transporter [Planctomycetota bacterium]
MTDPEDRHSASVLPSTSPSSEDATRYAQGRRAAIVSIVGNCLLAAVKLALGLLTNSISLMADAAHTASDMLTSIVVWIGLRVARQPADAKHPYGHGRAETIAALVVAVLLGAVGLDLAVSSISRALRPPKVGEEFGSTGMLLAAGFILASVFFKAWMGYYASRVGHTIKNQSLLADAWHHYSDAFSSILVVIALVLARYGIYGADGWLGLGVSIVLLGTAWFHMKMAGSALLGERPDEELVQRIEGAARSVHGVIGVHGVAVHDYGRRKVTSLHIELTPNLPLDGAHHVASQVETAIAQQTGLMALVHAEPQSEQRFDKRIAAIRSTVSEMLARHPSIVSFHALSVLPEDHGLEVEFHVHIRPGTPIEDAHKLEHGLEERLLTKLGDLHVHVHVEPCQLGCPNCPAMCGVERPAG